MAAGKKGEGPPPSYEEAHRYPQFDTHGQPISNLGPPLSQTGSIFTYNIPTTDHQETYSSQPGGPPALTGIPPRAPGAPPPEYVLHTSLNPSTNTYGARFGAQFGGFGVSLPTQYGAQDSSFYPIHSKVVQSTALMESRTVSAHYHQGQATIYTPKQLEIYRGYKTSPEAYSKRHVTTAAGRQNRKLVLSIVCFIILVILIISIFFGTFIA